MQPVAAPERPLNDPLQYDDLVAEWWRPGGLFSMLHWLAAARAELIPPAGPAGPGGSVLVDVACGGGLMAPHVRRLGYRHVGVDIGEGSTRTARGQGVAAVRGDALHLPLRDASADVVVAGEVLEHVRDYTAVVREVGRVLRPGGTVVIDTIAATRRGRFIAVTVAERIPGGPPKRLHDPDLFVDRAALRAAFADQGITLRLSGLMPDPVGYVRWLRDRTRTVRMRRVADTGALFQGSGTKQPPR
jgi:2-polyprenyl-6-hydroxyphenyl methylase/3-demethylubiquinone-9 3-methyltransferase